MMNKDEVNNERVPEVIKISASSVKTFEQCPRKYFYTYIEKEPRKHWDHLDVGNLAHNTLELFHERIIRNERKGLSLQKLMGECFSVSRVKFPKLSDDLVQETKDMLIEYLGTIKGKGKMPTVKSVEQPFVFNITDDIIIRGYIDRVDVLPDGTLHIVDYKTTKNKKYLNDFQVLVYGLWLREQYPNIDKFKGSYILLRHGSSYMSYDFVMDDVLKVKEQLIKYANGIRNENLWTPIPTFLCGWCDFQKVCPSQTTW